MRAPARRAHLAHRALKLHRAPAVALLVVLGELARRLRQREQRQPGRQVPCFGVEHLGIEQNQVPVKLAMRASTLP